MTSAIGSAVTPALTPLISSMGTTWFAAVEISPPSVLLAPDETGVITVAIDLPPDLVPGEYRGALILQGFRDGGIPLSVTVVDPHSQRKEAPAARGRRTRKRPATRTRRARR